MKRLNTLLLTLCLLCPSQLWAKAHTASLLGIRSDGSTLNTLSMQTTIDYINEQGDSSFQFWPERYLTGMIFLKSNVELSLNEGAGPVVSMNFYARNIGTPFWALIYAQGGENVVLTGLGGGDSLGYELAYDLRDKTHRGLRQDGLTI